MNPVSSCHTHGKFIFLLHFASPIHTPSHYLTGFFPRNPSSLPLSLYFLDVQHADVGPVPSFKEPRDPEGLA